MDHIALITDIISALILGGVLAHALVGLRRQNRPPLFEQATADDKPFAHPNHAQGPMATTIGSARLWPYHEFQPVLADTDRADPAGGDLPQNRRHGLG